MLKTRVNGCVFVGISELKVRDGILKTITQPKYQSYPWVLPWFSGSPIQRFNCQVPLQDPNSRSENGGRVG
eukprot:658444-Hanusia_phi.AAC.2